MAETQISNVIVPEVFTDYTLEPSIYRSRFVKSNVLSVSPQLNNLLSGGGTTFNLPYWQDLVQSESDIPNESVETTINNINAEKQIAVRLEREKAWGANNISGLLAGDNPMDAIGQRVMGYWTEDYDRTLISMANGVIADNIANNSSDLVHVTATPFDDDGVIDAQGLLGENGLVGSQAESGNDYVGIAVRPEIYQLMRKEDLITEVPVSGQQRPIPFYMGMQVVVDRNLENNGGVFTSIIFKSGAFSIGQSQTGYLPTELDRKPGLGFGTDLLYTRRHYSIHPLGTAFQSASVAGISPTNTELADATNWSRVYNKENVRFVAYKATLV